MAAQVEWFHCPICRDPGSLGRYSLMAGYPRYKRCEYTDQLEFRAYEHRDLEFRCELLPVSICAHDD